MSVVVPRSGTLTSSMTSEQATSGRLAIEQATDVIVATRAIRMDQAFRRLESAQIITIRPMSTSRMPW
jgi:hypothetical protein